MMKKKKKGIMMKPETGEEEIGEPEKMQKRRKTAEEVQSEHGFLELFIPIPLYRVNSIFPSTKVELQ